MAHTRQSWLIALEKALEHHVDQNRWQHTTADDVIETARKFHELLTGVPEKEQV